MLTSCGRAILLSVGIWLGTLSLTTVEPLSIVVDVGGVYDHEAKRYDHHQRGFNEVFGNGFDTVKLSSAGLVYKHYGKQIIAKLLDTEDDAKVHTLWLQLYSELIESIDGIDNGVNIASGKLAYNQRTDLSSRVKRINPRWNEPSSDDILDAQFEIASKVTGEEFSEQLDYFAKAWLPARDIVEAAVKDRKNIDPSGQIVVFQQVNEVDLLWRSELTPRPHLGRTTCSTSRLRSTPLPRSYMSSTPRLLDPRRPSGVSSVSPSRQTRSSTAGRCPRRGAGCAMRRS